MGRSSGVTRGFRSASSLLPVALSLVLGACGGGPEPEALEGFPFDPNPRAISVTLESQGKVTQRISPEGGAITTVGANGTTYSVIFPEGALLSEKEITITPVASAGGLPMSGGLLDAVHLEPEGLRLNAPATLMITRASAISTGDKKLTGFGYHGQGAEFHLFPTLVAGNTVQMQLLHFSGYGTGAASDADIADQRKHAPTAPEDQANQERAADSSPERTAQLLQGLWEKTVVPQIEWAGGDLDNRLDSAYVTYLTFVATVRAWDHEDTFAEKIREGAEQIGALIIKALNEAHQKCVFQNDPVQVAKMLRWLTWGFKHPDISMWIQSELIDFRTKAEDCLRFELTFRSRVESNAEGVNTWAEVEAIAPIYLTNPIEFQPYVFQGQGTLNYLDLGWEETGSECVFDFTGNSSSFDVSELEIDLDLTAMPFAENQRGVRLLLGILNPTERLMIHCPDESAGPYDMGFWTGGFMLLHLEKLDQLGAAYRFNDWTAGIGNIWAQIHSTESDPTVPMNEDTRFELKHTPRR